MKMYIKYTAGFAGKTIYKGFAKAWESIGYEVLGYNEVLDVPTSGEYEIMASDYDIGSFNHLKHHPLRKQLLSSPMGQHHLPHLAHASPEQIDAGLDEYTEKVMNDLGSAKRAYVFAQPTKFPEPWGNHINFTSQCAAGGCELIKRINEMPNNILWTWGMMSTEWKNNYFREWKDFNVIPLAFDSISYESAEDPAYEYDVCFVGGWADNGFNEKKPIMLSHFKHLMNSGLKCGIFINKNLTHQQENLILYNSKVALNIHDAYQRILGNDSNERTFKSLGLTGALVCDNIRQVGEMFPKLPLYNTPEEMVEQVQGYLSNPKQLQETKEHYRDLIANNHTYVHRVKQMRDL